MEQVPAPAIEQVTAPEPSPTPVAVDPTATLEAGHVGQTETPAAEPTETQPATLEAPADSAAPAPAEPLNATLPGGFAIKKRERKPKASATEQAPGQAPAKKVSAIDAAATVLAEAGKPMSCKEMIGAMAAKGYWTSPGGATPHATLNAAILREIAVKGEQSRFVKAAPGRFALRATVQSPA
jgi:hypothetical protein